MWKAYQMLRFAFFQLYSKQGSSTRSSLAPDHFAVLIVKLRSERRKIVLSFVGSRSQHKQSNIRWPCCVYLLPTWTVATVVRFSSVILSERIPLKAGWAVIAPARSDRARSELKRIVIARDPSRIARSLRRIVRSFPLALSSIWSRRSRFEERAADPWSWYGFSGPSVSNVKNIIALSRYF